METEDSFVLGRGGEARGRDLGELGSVVCVSLFPGVRVVEGFGD